MDVLRNAQSQPGETNHVQVFKRLVIAPGKIKFIFTNMHVYICVGEKLIKQFLLKLDLCIQ